MRTTPIGHKYDPHHPDLEGRQVVLADDFKICKKQGYDILTDYEKERAQRLAAERQVGELREQLDKALLTKANKNWRDLNEIAADRDSALAKLDTAMGFLRDVSEVDYIEHHVSCIDEIRALINTTSTEGKDHE